VKPSDAILRNHTPIAPDAIAKITNSAAAHDDRWMLIAAIVIVVVASLLALRWMAGDRSEMARRLTEITDRHIAQGIELAKLVANNTEALSQNTATMRQVLAVIDECPKPHRRRTDTEFFEKPHSKQ